MTNNKELQLQKNWSAQLAITWLENGWWLIIILYSAEVPSVYYWAGISLSNSFAVTLDFFWNTGQCGLAMLTTINWDKE